MRTEALFLIAAVQQRPQQRPAAARQRSSKGPAEARQRPSTRYGCTSMPRIWLYTQVAIIVFVCIGIVIAITRLA